MLPHEVGTNDPVVPLPEPVQRPAPIELPLMERAGVSPPPALSSAPDGLALLKALRRRWLLALTLGILAAAAAFAAVWFLLPPNYQVSAQLRVASTAPSILGRNSGDGRGDWTAYLKTQMGQVRGPWVLWEVLRRDEIKRLPIILAQADPYAWLHEELKVESPEGSELVMVYVNGSESDQLIAIVNAVTDASVKLAQEEESKKRQERSSDLEKAHGRFREDLRRKRDNWNAQAKGLSTSDPHALTQKQLMLLNTFNQVRLQHSQVRFDLVRAKSRLESLQAQEKMLDSLPVPEAMLNEAIDTDPMGRGHVLMMAKWDEIIDRYKEHARRPESEPSYREALKQKAALQKKLDERKEELRGTLRQRVRQRNRGEYDTALAQLQHEIASLEKQDVGLSAEVKQLQGETEKIGTLSAELEVIRAEIKSDEDTLARMAQELDQVRVEVNSAPRVSLFQPATALRKDGRRQLMALTGAPLVAFLGVCFAVSWWDFRGRRVHTPDEVLAGIGLRVVGSVPAFPRNAAVPLLPEGEGATEFEHSLLESIDGIRTLLLRESSVEPTRVLMVTSAVSGEGKTTLATHLAGSLARAGRRTLLIDCDLRRPSIHQMFELPPQPGLSEVLLGEVHLAEATLATPVSGLWVVPAGQWDRNVMQALARDDARAVFEKLKAEYDFVVIDSHPVLPATDSLLIAQHADAVIFSLLREVSQMPKVYAACQRLTSLGVRVLGAVVNGTQEDTYAGGYQYAAPAPQA